jgi:hypothetical protein
VGSARDAFRAFGADVAANLMLLWSALHGAPVAATDLPDLRTERDALVNLETDRFTNSLRTLSLEIFQWLHSPAAR